MKYILSTLTNPFIFVKYGEPQPGGIPPMLRRIKIAGGANRPSLRGFGEMSTDNEGVPMWTPRGMVSPVSDEDFEWLQENQGFKNFLQAGLMKMTDRDPGNNHDRIAKLTSDMAKRDSMSPITPDDPRRKKVKIGERKSFDNETSNSDDISALLET